MIGYCDQAQGGNRFFYSHYRAQVLSPPKE
jgi:hypothetical protein